MARLEQAETINRLLKKQSRSRGKRNVLSTAEDRPTPGASGSNHGGDVEMEESEEVAPPVPKMYRWISTSKMAAGTQDAPQAAMALSFSVPIAALPHSRTSQETALPSSTLPPKPRCDVEGCDAQRKYRLVKDWKKGACGMTHLKVLEAQIAPMAQ